MLRVLLIFLFFATTPAGAQNLVPNPGFESYTLCPYQRSNVAFSPDYSLFPSVSAWVSALWNTTPDYYNYCATDTLVSMPYNTYNDYQHPRSGAGCIGFSMMSGHPYDLQLSDYREYAEARLVAPLEPGQQYYVSYFVNMTYHIPWDYVQIVVDQLGARLTDTQLNYQYPFGEPQLIIPGPSSIATPLYTYLSDTAAWMKVSGLYTAHGGEQWLTLGYFRDSLPIHHIVLYTPVADTYSKHVACYMYVDDVCVSRVSPPTHDTLYAAGFPYTLSAPMASSHQWSTGATTRSITIQAPGTYWVTTTDDCYYQVDTFTVLCAQQQVHSDTVIYASAFPISISAPAAPDSLISIMAPGIYEVALEQNCVSYLHRVEVVQRAASDCIWLPSAFSPNGDGKNDAFGPVFSCYSLPQYYTFSIYNRFGERVFETDQPTARWDGSYKGRLADVGTYYYMLRYSHKAKSKRVRASDPDIVLLKGDLTLLR